MVWELIGMVVKALFGTKDWIGMDKQLFSRYVERSENFVANLEVWDGLPTEA